MALDLNASPYYDDYSDSKSFHRILFKPGVAVQARELTQVQTLLQNQIDKGFGFVLQEGAVVTGCAESKVEVEWIKILDTDSASAAVDNSTLVNYVGDTVTGGTSGIKAVIIETVTGTEAAEPATKKLYLKYTDMGGQTTYSHFTSSETLTVTSTDSGRNGKTFVTGTGTSSTDLRANYYGSTFRVTLEPGVIFAKGAFIKTEKITSLQNRYGRAVGGYVGFLITEATINSATDTTLLDPAQGSFNYNAPGADRLKYTVELKSYNASETLPENFVVYYEIQDGTALYTRTVDNPLSGLGKILAERTFDESGSYVVRGKTTNVREHLKTATNNGVFSSSLGGNADGLVIGVQPGRCYVGGHKRDLRETKRLVIRKTSNVVTKESSPLSTSIGNYIEVNYISGMFDVDGGGVIDLYNAVQDGASSPAGTKVGTARVRHFVYSSGTVGSTSSVYRLYVYDVKMLSGNFSAVKGVRYVESGVTTNGIANVVLTGGVAEIKEAERNKSLFAMPYKNVKTIAADSSSNDYTYQFTKEFDLTLDATNGDGTLTLTGDETFPYTVGGDLTDTIKNANIIAVAKMGFGQNSATIQPGEFIDLTAGTSSVELTGTQAMKIDTGGAITTTGSQSR